MAKGVKSARGVVVDFDLLKIKQEIASAPKTTSVAARENFIDQKFKRRMKKLKSDVAKTASSAQAPGEIDTAQTPEDPADE